MHISLEKARQLCHRFAVSSTALRAHRAGSERPVAGVEGRRIEARRVREDECLKSRLLRGTRSPMRPSHTAWQLLLSLANKRRFQRQIQEADLYRTAAIHKTNLIARRLRKRPHNARPAQLALHSGAWALNAAENSFSKAPQSSRIAPSVVGCTI